MTTEKKQDEVQAAAETNQTANVETTTVATPVAEEMAAPVDTVAATEGNNDAENAAAVVDATVEQPAVAAPAAPAPVNVTFKGQFAASFQATAGATMGSVLDRLTTAQKAHSFTDGNGRAVTRATKLTEDVTLTASVKARGG